MLFRLALAPGPYTCRPRRGDLVADANGERHGGGPDGRHGGSQGETQRRDLLRPLVTDGAPGFGCSPAGLCGVELGHLGLGLRRRLGSRSGAGLGSGDAAVPGPRVTLTWR